VRFRLSVAVALVVVASVACDTVDSAGITGPVRDKTITMPGNTFDPDVVTIPVGGKVLWVGSGVVHNVAFGSPDAPSGCGNWSFGDCLRTFPVAGIFDYLCTLHPGMVGRVTVQ
jgi:plastocyanin